MGSGLGLPQPESTAHVLKRLVLSLVVVVWPGCQEFRVLENSLGYGILKTDLGFTVYRNEVTGVF